MKFQKSTRNSEDSIGDFPKISTEVCPGRDLTGVSLRGVPAAQILVIDCIDSIRQWIYHTARYFCVRDMNHELLVTRPPPCADIECGIVRFYPDNHATNHYKRQSKQETLQLTIRYYQWSCHHNRLKH